MSLSLTREAAAGSPHSVSYDGEFAARGDRIELSFDHGHATLRGEMTVQNVGTATDDAMIYFGEASSAVATGLRLLDDGDARPRWRSATLQLRELAFDDFVGAAPGNHPGVAALLQQEEYGDGLELLLGPLAPGATQTVEYTLMIAARWQQGRWQLELEGLGSYEDPVDIVLTPAHRGDQLFVDDRVVVSGHAARSTGWLSIGLAPDDPAPIDLGLASVETGGDRALVHVQTSVATLSTLPKDAKIVVLVDLSRSREQEQVAAQITAALAYLEHFRPPALGAEVAAFGFDRELRPITSGFAPASVAIERLEQAEDLPRRNGSEVGLALAKAEALLRGTRRRTPRRILLLSDFMTASRVTPALLEDTAVRSGAIIHLAQVGWGGDWLTRDDEHPWSELAGRTGGVYWDAGVDEEEPEVAHALLEEWARPLRIDALELRFDGRSTRDIAGLDCEACEIETLAEGEGLEALLLAPDGVGVLSLDGLSWGQRVHLEAKASPAANERWAALAFGSPVHERLSRDEVACLATLGGAVSSETSLYAATPGARAERELLFGGSATCMCEDSFRGLGNLGLIGQGTAKIDPFDPQAWLMLNLPAQWRGCGTDDEGAVVTLETTWDEIVDVELRSRAPAAVQACMVESIWALELPAEFGREMTARYEVEA